MNMEDRNPSPPPEVEEEPDVYLPDIVGDTVISKHWVLTTLMDLINEVKKHCESEGDGPLDVSDDIQDSACKLWDLCMDENVAVFLIDFDIVDILYDVIMKSKSPRITEISVGILGNMVCCDKACEVISKYPNLRSVLLALLASPDTQTLLELVRLLRVCLTSHSCSDVWVKTVESSGEEFLQKARFIFSSSTNGKLLRSLSEVFDHLFEVNSSFLKTCCTTDFIGALLEAVDQIAKDDEVNSMHLVCPSVHALHNISLVEEGRKRLGVLRRDTLAIVSSLCQQWMTVQLKVEYNNSSEMSSNEVSVSCCLSLSSMLLQVDNKAKEDERGKENSDEILEVDDEDREVIFRFARCIISAKGVLSALSKMLSVAERDGPQDEFKTPLHVLRGSPRCAASSSLSQQSKPSDQVPACATHVSNCTLATPDQTPETASFTCSDRTPPADGGSPDVESPSKSGGGDRRALPAGVLCDLAKELLDSCVAKPSVVADASPDHAEK